MSFSQVITYDRRSFAFNNSPFIILSGSVHYIRIHPSRWQDLFQTFHDAHLNTIETYVFWGHHEPPPHPAASPFDPLPPPTFAGHLDLFSFIRAAGKAGLYVILRLGPYVCAEVNYGGLPVRLRDEPGIKFRTWNQPFMDRLEAWVTLLTRTIQQHQLFASQNNGGPVILVQLENEYSMVSHTYGDDGVRYLQWVADLQRRLRLNVPAIMCYGAAKGVVETINAFYAHEKLEEFRSKHPTQPPIWTECWTGWYDVWGAPHHIRPVKDLLYAVARFFAAGGAGVNYYMWMGGTNIGRASTMYLQTTSYDYDAPIDELYRHTVKSRRLAKLHEALLAHQKSFHGRRLDDPQPEKLTCSAGNYLIVYKWGEICYLCNDDVKRTWNGWVPSLGQRQFTVQPRSVVIVHDKSGVLFDTASDVDPKTGKEPFSSASTGGEWRCAPEQIPTLSWCHSLLEKQSASVSRDEKIKDADLARVISFNMDSPCELVQLNRGSSDYAWYTTRYEIGHGAFTVSFEAADFAQVFIDGRLQGRTELPLWEDRWSNRWNDYSEEGGGPGCAVRVTSNANAERHKSDSKTIEVCILVASLGMVKGDWQLGERNMQDEKKGLLSDVTIESVQTNTWKGKRISAWYSIAKLDGEVKRWGEVGLGDVENMKKVEERVENGALVNAPIWMDCHVKVQRTSIPWIVDARGVCHTRMGGVSKRWMVDLSGFGKGVLYVNGVYIGRFWNVCGTRPRNGFLDNSPIVQVVAENNGKEVAEPTQRYYHIPEWVVPENDRYGKGAVNLHVVLFVECGPVPTNRLVLLEAGKGRL